MDGRGLRGSGRSSSAPALRPTSFISKVGTIQGWIETLHTQQSACATGRQSYQLLRYCLAQAPVVHMFWNLAT